MNVYLAAHDADLALAATVVLERFGHRVISTWHSEPLLATESVPESERRMIAVVDLVEVRLCDALVLLSGPERYSGGKFVEAGYALALHKPVVCVGRRENMMLWHPGVECAATVEEAALMLADVPVERPAGSGCLPLR